MKGGTYTVYKDPRQDSGQRNISPLRHIALLNVFDVTKIQTKKLSILPRFYFHDALEQLKTNFDTNFRFKRVLGLVKEYA